MTLRSLTTTRDLFALGARRLLLARLWALLQFAGLALLIAVSLVWTRIPEKNVFEVILTLLVPLLVAAGFLALQAALLRSLLRSEPGAAATPQPSASFALGALTLVLWIAIGWVLWNFIDRFDAHTNGWAMYLNSRFNADYRARIFTYEHISRWFDHIAWFLRWIVVPGLLLPLGCTALYGLRRVPWWRVVRVWIAWRWWLVVLILALIGEVLPGYFFAGDPKGSVQAQIWKVILKLIAAYIISVLCWVLALAWSAALLIGIDTTQGASTPEPVPLPKPANAPPLSLDDAGDHLRGNA
jgi:hypothetical protein